jgi:serine/threonine protein kinase
VLGVHAETPSFVAVEKRAGWWLSERLDSGPLDPEEVLKLVQSLAQGLAAAHAAGLHHLGISEEAILLPRYEDDLPQVLGFGLPTSFEHADLVGWHYLPPEQLASQSDCDHRSDIYALGILACRCATGKFPIAVSPGATPDQLAGALILGQRRDPREWLKPPLDAMASIIRRAIHADRTMRYQSMAELLADLKSAGFAAAPCAVPCEIVANEHTERVVARDLVTAVERAGSISTPALEIPTTRQRILRAPTPSDDSDSLIGQEVAGLTFLRKLGAGGMGAVYLAQSRAALGRSHAVKVAFAGLSERAERRFRQEALVMAELKEKGVKRVVEIHSVGRLPSGEPYIEMEYVPGRSLDQVIYEEKRLPLFRALKILDSICHTLEHAHNLGIVHRDVKPSNIIIEADQGQQTHKLRVLDWGIARAVGELKQVVTDVNTQTGTLGYMAVESVLGNPVDGRADVFSCAVILYEMLAGERPFNQTDERSVLDMTVHATPPPLASRRPEIPRSVSDLVNAGLAKHRDERPTMAEFRKMIQAVLEQLGGGAPVSPLHTLRSAGTPLELPNAKKPTRIVYSDPKLHELLQPKPRRRSLIALLLSLALVGASAWAYLRSAAPRQPPAPSPIRSSEPALVHLLVATSPSGATVATDGTVLGTSPLILSGALGNKQHLRFSLAGYDDTDADVVFSNREEKLSIQLPATVIRPKHTQRRPKPIRSDGWIGDSLADR